MRSQREGGLSAITKVKVSSPEIVNIAQGQGFHFLEANTVECVKGEHISGVPGSKSMAGNSTVYNGTWENHNASYRSFLQAEEARWKYGDMVVGLTNSRGVAGVMSGEDCIHSKGLAVRRKRDEVTYAIH